MPLSAAQKRVLVLGDDTQSFLASVRSLGRAGLTVEVSMPRPGTPAAASRYISALHALPPLHRPEEWFEALNRLMAERDFAFVLPCYDTHAAILHAGRGELLHAERYALLAPEAYSVAAFQAHTYRLATRLGIPAPAQVHAYRESDVDAAIQEFGFPLVLRPVESVSADAPAKRIHLKKAASGEESRRAFHYMNRGDGVLLQKNFAGKGVGVEFVAKNGLMLALLQHERLHEPVHGGESSYRRSVPLRLPLAEAAIAIARELHWNGPGIMQCREDRRSGEWALISLKGWLWGSLPLSAAAGLDVPRLVYEIWTGQSPNPPQTYRHGIYARNWQLDVAWFRQNFEADASDPTLLRVSAGELLRETVNVLSGRERSDTFALDDPQPALEEARALASSTVRPHWMYSITGRERLKRRAEEAVRDASAVLFVCLGNICRSPFAELALRKYAGDSIRVSSAGMITEAGRLSPAAALRAAEAFEIDLTEHHSRIVDVSRTADVEAIFVFDRWHERMLLESVPEARRKVHFLGALDVDGPLEILDPFGRTEAVYRSVYQTIDRLAARMAELRLSDIRPAGPEMNDGVFVEAGDDSPAPGPPVR